MYDLLLIFEASQYHSLESTSAEFRHPRLQATSQSFLNLTSSISLYKLYKYALHPPWKAQSSTSTFDHLLKDSPSCRCKMNPSQIVHAKAQPAFLVAPAEPGEAACMQIGRKRPDRDSSPFPVSNQARFSLPVLSTGQEPRYRQDRMKC